VLEVAALDLLAQGQRVGIEYIGLPRLIGRFAVPRLPTEFLADVALGLKAIGFEPAVRRRRRIDPLGQPRHPRVCQGRS
jgi:hypothetical protein